MAAIQNRMERLRSIKSSLGTMLSVGSKKHRRCKTTGALHLQDLTPRVPAPADLEKLQTLGRLERQNWGSSWRQFVNGGMELEKELAEDATSRPGRRSTGVAAAENPGA